MVARTARSCKSTGLEPAVDSPDGSGLPYFGRARLRAVGGAPSSRTWLKLRVVADAFEQELLTDIAEAEAIGQDDLAAEWRLAAHLSRCQEAGHPRRASLGR
jgi:hypothetical protein